MENKTRNALDNKNEIWKMLFSFDGVFNQPAFIAGMCLIHFIEVVIKSFAISILDYAATLLFLFPVLIVIQKRCRDFNSKGTLFIAVYTLLIVCMSADCFVNDKSVLPFYEYIRYAEAIMCAIVMLLFFIPSKKERDENLLSPLLKYPFLYTMICWILAIVATLAVNSYAGVELNLF